ncbi:MAG: hypothetical protein A3K46_01530 [Chloroflexi bacterium RBG_13_60_9]|nr:MAG: hypothetical protein A3K46_01530 [Chloroflexi bacterium RBG_13_60_9]
MIDSFRFDCPADTGTSKMHRDDPMHFPQTSVYMIFRIPTHPADWLIADYTREAAENHSISIL